MSRCSFYFSQLATLGALELQILPLQNAATVQPKEQPASRENSALHKKAKNKRTLRLNITLQSPHRTFASRPPITRQHSSHWPALFPRRRDSSRPGTAKATPMTLLLPPLDQLIMEATGCENLSPCPKASRTQVQEYLIGRLHHWRYTAVR